MLAIRGNFLRQLPPNCIIRKYVLSPIPEDPKKKKKSDNDDDDDDDDVNGEAFRKFKMKQLKFQSDDGVPIHLKCGRRDRLLYYTTLLLAGFGLVNYFGFIFYSALSEKDKKKYDNFWQFRK